MAPTNRIVKAHVGDICPVCGKPLEHTEIYEWGPRGAGTLYWHVGDKPPAETCWIT